MLSTTSPMTAVLPVVDPQTGDVLAMATSKKYGTSGRNGTTSQPIFTTYTAQARVDLQAVPAAGRARRPASTRPLPAEDTRRRRTQWQSCPPDNGAGAQRRRERVLQPGRQPDDARGDGQVVQHVLRRARRPAASAASSQPIIAMAQRLGITSFSEPSGEPHTVGRAVDPAVPARHAAHPRRHRDQPARADRRLRRGRQRRPVQRAGADPVDHRRATATRSACRARRASRSSARRSRARPSTSCTGDTTVPRHVGRRVHELVRDAPRARRSPARPAPRPASRRARTRPTRTARCGSSG